MPNDSVGLGGYRNDQEAPSAPHRVLTMLRRKITLRTSLTLLQGEIDSALNTFSKAEITQLQDLVQTDIDTADSDVALFRHQLDNEAALAESTRPAQVTISRQAVDTLAAEIEHRTARGIFPSKEGLIAEALRIAYGNRA